MAKDTTKCIEWAEVVDVASAESGFPKKELHDGAEALAKAVETVLEKYQPKKDGDSLEVTTPFCVVTSTRLPESIVTDANGAKFTRPSCCAVNTCVRTSFITAANIGLVDPEAVEKVSSGKKSA